MEHDHLSDQMSTNADESDDGDEEQLEAGG